MSLLDSIPGSLDGIQNKIKNPFSAKVNKDQLFGHDFPEGLLIEEVENTKEKIRLTGNAMPFIPFVFGGKQRVIKEFYPGNSEPVVHIFGPEEDNMTIQGRFKDKRFANPSGVKDGSLYGLATELQQAIDAIRIRGNLIRLVLGEFQRYGYIESTEFRMRRLGDVEYSITFSIVGFNAPRDCQFLEKTREIPFTINKDLIAKLAEFQAQGSGGIPDEVPRSLAELMNEAIGTVAGVINLVTNFVDTVIGTAEDVGRSINRAQGLIKNARANISVFRRRIGAIGYNVTGDPVKSKFISPALSNQPRTSQYITASHTNNLLSSFSGLSSLLEQLRKQFAEIAKTVPLFRHLVKSGDTLQKLAVANYGSAEDWKRIYDHNKLTSTTLVSGTVLEIPRI